MAQSFLLVTFDAFAMYEALVVAYLLRSTQDQPAPSISADTFRDTAFTLTPFWLIAFGALGLYTQRSDRGPFKRWVRYRSSAAVWSAAAARG